MTVDGHGNTVSLLPQVSNATLFVTTGPEAHPAPRFAHTAAARKITLRDVDVVGRRGVMFLDL